MNPLPTAAKLGKCLGGAAENTLTRLKRIEATVHNFAEYARYGSLRVDEESAPYEVVGGDRMYRLRHYFPTRRSTGYPRWSW
ncbi:hypothetical protein [Amycolatopsis japonica]